MGNGEAGIKSGLFLGEGYVLKNNIARTNGSG
jgi:hypothetical protein